MVQHTKITADVDRLTELFSLSGSISQPKYERIAALVNDLGIDRAERALLILAGENPDAPMTRSARAGKQSDILTKSKTAPSSLVEQMVKRKTQGKQSLVDEIVGGKK